MSNSISNNIRIVKNTLFLYFRMLLVMLVTLYTSRVVLDELGIDDYGIYNVVGGIVAMFTILSGSLSSAISRFITFELGANDKIHLRSVFSTAIIIQAIMAISVFFIVEIVGFWFLNTKMNISQERLYAANWVLQCSIFSFVINLINVPYNALIIAHEKMKAFAYIGIVEVLLKLFIALSIPLFSEDKLIVYSFLLFLTVLVLHIIYRKFCKFHFQESQFHLIWDWRLIKEMSSFAGWNFIGVSSAVLRDQGVNIAINIFCGVTVNAARGLSMQVSHAISSFGENFLTAIKPQITKSYASGEYSYMMTLVFQGTRFSFYLLLLLSLPIIIETETILSLWLVSIPEHTVNFIRLILMCVLSNSLSNTLITAMLATGKIRNYQITVGGLQMLDFPISYFLLSKGIYPEITFLVSLFISQMCLAVRLFMLRSSIGLSIHKYIKNVYLNVIAVTSSSIILPIIFYLNMESGGGRFILSCFICLFSTLLSIFYIGCTPKERSFICEKLYFFVLKKHIDDRN